MSTLRGHEGWYIPNGCQIGRRSLWAHSGLRGLIHSEWLPQERSVKTNIALAYWWKFARQEWLTTLLRGFIDEACHMGMTHKRYLARAKRCLSLVFQEVRNMGITNNFTKGLYRWSLPHGDDSQLLLSTANGDGSFKRTETTNRTEVIVGTLWPKRADTVRMAAKTYKQSEAMQRRRRSL